MTRNAAAAELLNLSDTKTDPTAFYADILTVARDARAHEQAARQITVGENDPMDALYLPLGNKDVACVLQAKRT
ncbi:MAG: hypothetical protein AAF590_13220 [Pseudomonadota bacterium]